jgi:hypothetical protein
MNALTAVSFAAPELISSGGGTTSFDVGGARQQPVGPMLEKEAMSGPCDHASSKLDAVISRIRPVLRPLVHDESCTVLQNWEGFVVEVGESTFTARLLDRTSNNKIDTEIAEIPFDEVEDGDRDLVREGAILYFTIRRRRMSNGRHEVVSQLVFRRLPAWHSATLKRLEDEATRLDGIFANFD